MIDAELTAPDVAVLLLSPEMDEPDPPAFLIEAAGDFLPNWRLALNLGTRDLFSAAADRQVTIYLWTGVTVAVLIAMLAGSLRSDNEPPCKNSKSRTP